MSNDLWYGTTGPRNARIMVVGEAWGADEDRLKKPFQGTSGQELDKMLAEAGIKRDEVFVTNIIAARPPKNELYHWFTPTKEAREKKETSINGLYPNGDVRAGLERLYRQVDELRPDLIIGCGNYPFWAFSSNVKIGNSTTPSGWKVPGGITTWRGSQLISDVGRPGYRFLPIIHPASILYQWSSRAITVHDLRVRVPLALRKSWSKPTRTYIAPPTFRECINYFNRLDVLLGRGSVEAVGDIETSKRLITCLGLTIDGRTAISIPFLKPGPDGFRDSYWTFNEEKVIVRRLRAILLHPNFSIIGQNFLYDIQYLSRWWRAPPKISFDTMLAQHVMFPGTPKPLWYLASLYSSDFYCYWKEDSKEWEEVENLNQHLIYNCDDLFYTWICWQKQKDALIRMNLVEQFAFIMKCQGLAFEMMERGILIDKKNRTQMSLDVMAAAAERQEWLNKVVPEWVRPAVGRTAKPWYTSARQQQELFYQILGLKSVYHRKTGNVTVDDSALSEIALRYPELTRLTETIAELRSLGVFQNNFLSAAIDPDNRMRCSFNPGGTETFRWSASQNAFGRGTNLQNIPTGDD